MPCPIAAWCAILRSHNVTEKCSMDYRLTGKNHYGAHRSGRCFVCSASSWAVHDTRTLRCFLFGERNNTKGIKPNNELASRYRRNRPRGRGCPANASSLNRLGLRQRLPILASLGVLVRAGSLRQNKTSNGNRRTTQEEESTVLHRKRQTQRAKSAAG
jgi:hypothetical protein